MSSSLSLPNTIVLPDVDILAILPVTVEIANNLTNEVCVTGIQLKTLINIHPFNTLCVITWD
jgi:hypothetical protein